MDSKKANPCASSENISITFEIVQFRTLTKHFRNIENDIS